MANLTRKLNFPTNQVREKVIIKLADGFRTTFPLQTDPQDVTSQGISGLQTTMHHFLFRSIVFHTVTRLYSSSRIIFALPSCRIRVSYCGICNVKAWSHLLAHRIPARFQFEHSS